jgi:pimeloyl-ACP methyl ester carboxylesterase
MNDTSLPPVRTTHIFRAPAGLWSYDMWGRHGRPVVLIPAVLFDRVMWWPTAADLRPHATVIAVDLPGHGASTRRSRYDPEEIVDDLADLLYSLGTRRAPVVVGHAGSAALAALYAARYATHAVVAVDPPAPATSPPGVAEYLTGMDLDCLPVPYADMMTPAHDPVLLAAYQRGLRLDPPTTASAATEYLAVHSRAPAIPPPCDPVAEWRHEVYDVPGRFPHLTDVPRFVADLKALL